MVMVAFILPLTALAMTAQVEASAPQPSSLRLLPWDSLSSLALTTAGRSGGQPNLPCLLPPVGIVKSSILDSPGSGISDRSYPRPLWPGSSCCSNKSNNRVERG
ncbi:hypothetical protein NL676_007923 [Syzygium grande]|nr:hypothetical protein NL676_007923 [Syzygium grande]